MATTLGIDVSHFQGRPNFAQVKASGREFVIHKVTESTNYVDPMCAANRAAAHAAGLIVGLYHFARAGNAAAEAAWFLRQVGALRSDEFLVLDWEVSAADPVGWCKAWLDAMHAATGRKPLIYMNQSAMGGVNWTPVVAADYALWQAKYDNSTAPPAVKWWPAAAMKQFSDKGIVPGVAGPVDVDVFYGTRDQLLAYCAGGAITQGGSDVLTDEDITKLWYGPRFRGDMNYAQVIQAMQDGINAIARQTQALDLAGRPGGPSDDQYGHILSLRAELEALAAKVNGAAAPAAVNVDAAAVATALGKDANFLAAIAKAVADENARRQQA